MSNSFGSMFRMTTFGESHGAAIGCVIDGCPSQIPFSIERIQEFVSQRSPAAHANFSHSTARLEADRIELLSGVYDDLTLGSPICLLVRNTKQDSKSYDTFKHLFRPGHADLTVALKYGVRDHRGGGRLSARETVGRMLAGAVARELFRHHLPSLQVTARVESIGGFDAVADAAAMQLAIEDCRKSGDTLGGMIYCRVNAVPIGLGEPVFDKFHAVLAHALCSLPAVKGFEIGSGRSAAGMKGSEHNDSFVLDDHGNVTTKTNHAGGVLGGITLGTDIEFRVAFKPVPSLGIAQETLDEHLLPAKIALDTARHDVCVVPRAVPLVEAMTWCVLADFWLQHSNLLLTRSTST